MRFSFFIFSYISFFFRPRDKNSIIYLLFYIFEIETSKKINKNNGDQLAPQTEKLIQIRFGTMLFCSELAMTIMNGITYKIEILDLSKNVLFTLC